MVDLYFHLFSTFAAFCSLYSLSAFPFCASHIMEPDSDVEIVLIQERDPVLYPDVRDTTLTEDTIVLVCEN